MLPVRVGKNKTNDSRKRNGPRRQLLAETSTEFERYFKPRGSFVSGVSRHATRVFFGFNLTLKKVFAFKFGDVAEISTFSIFFPNGKDGKALKQPHYKTIWHLRRVNPRTKPPRSPLRPGRASHVPIQAATRKKQHFRPQQW
jgi:hypothetical protein